MDRSAFQTASLST